MAEVVQFTAPGIVEVVTYTPEPVQAGQVRVRTRFSGVSAGTELAAYRGTNPYLTRRWDPDQRLFLDGADTPAYPLTGWGYSEVGEVIEVAPDLADDPVAPRPGTLVWGIWGHRSEAVLPAAKLAGHEIPAGLDPIAATFARVGAVALTAVHAADLHLGETVAVFGQGVIGLLATRLAVLSGATVIAVDTIEARRNQAAAFGAHHLLDPRAGDVGAQVKALTGGLGADTAIEISGAHPALHEAIRTVAPAGRVVAAGFYQGEGTALRLGEEFHHNRVELVTAQIGGVRPGMWLRWDQERLNRTFLRLAAAGQVDPAALITHTVPVAQAPDIYRLLDQRPADALQTILEF
jgi:2-desacetyl-2-hydroxyethyl bacteriochlorophyllide A dehydrogenase